MGAEPALFSVYQQLQYLSQIYPDLGQVYPLSLPAYPYSTTFDPSSYLTMTAPESGSGVPSSDFSRPAPSSQPSPASHTSTLSTRPLPFDLPPPNDLQTGCEDSRSESDNEDELQEKSNGDDPTGEDTTNNSAADAAMPAFPKPKPKASPLQTNSAVKFSIDSILGLKTTDSDKTSPCGSITHSRSLSVCYPSDSQERAGTGVQPHNLQENNFGQEAVVTSAATRYDVKNYEQVDAQGSGRGGEGGRGGGGGRMTGGGAGGVGEMGDQHNYPWLQCTRYYPPKLQRSKKKDGGGKKRKLGRNPRVPFTQHQVAVLEEKFRRTHYLSSMDVAELSTALNLSETRVKIWFQNRRARERREREASQRAQLLTQKTYQPLSIPTVTWALTSQLAPSPFTAAQYRNDINFRAGLLSSAFSAFSTPETQPPSTCAWPEKHNSDDDSCY
ncbi:homeobox protein MSX-1-like [Littorina saxatilis]|uniref:homeobox protein MSX-1-like n=1 Tax=Littorina saxatilis TaxID=31220 RepID=UPI0038B666CA